MSLKDLIVTTKPRETSGPRSANRFDFQKSWALCQLLELHQSGSDYLIVFDYHDDILVLDSSFDPTRIDFFQIKTKQSGHWTRTALIAREKGKDGVELPSILGKLTHNKIQFPNHTGRLTFVSTQGFKLKLDGEDKESVLQYVTLEKLDANELELILNAIKHEHSLTDHLDCKSCTHLAETTLSLGDHTTHAMGKLGDFIEKLYPGEKVALSAIYRALCDEIKRKTNVEQLPADFTELVSHRSISRQAFEQMLQDVKPSTKFDTAIKEAIERLQHENIPFDEVRQIRQACTTYEVERMNSSDLVLAKARRAVAGVVARLQSTNAVPTKLADAIEAVRGAVREETKVLLSVRSEHFRTAMILMALYDI